MLNDVLSGRNTTAKELSICERCWASTARETNRRVDTVMSTDNELATLLVGGQWQCWHRRRRAAGRLFDSRRSHTALLGLLGCSARPRSGTCPLLIADWLQVYRPRPRARQKHWWLALMVLKTGTQSTRVCNPGAPFENLYFTIKIVVW